MTTAIISHPECLLHKTGDQHPERPDRVRVVQDALKLYSFKNPVEFLQAPLAKRSQLLLAHDADYIESIYAQAPSNRLIRLDEDTFMSPDSLQAALRAAGALVFAVDQVMQEKAKAAFCNVRPPGHHAEHNKAMGFCIFNNVAVGAAYAMSKYNLKRIAIVDFDVHRGNGTQDIFQNDGRVLFCSSFEYPLYPGYEKSMDNEHILSVAFAAEASSKSFCDKVAEAWFGKLKSFKPELIFVSAGFDAHADDPLGDLNLLNADYVWLTQELVKIANEVCGGKIVSALEGGYNLDVLAECVPAHVDELVG